MIRPFSALLCMLSTASGLVAGAALPFPAEGRWSIATGWVEGWPADWHHASATRTETSGAWTIHHGEFALPAGTLRVQDAERTSPLAAAGSLVEVRRRWEWSGKAPLERVTLSVRTFAALKNARPFLPGISTYDNPAGQAIDPTVIPVITAAQSVRRGFYEEHRYPMPFACAEGGDADEIAIAALHSVPSPMRFGNRSDQWWSLGLEYTEGGVELALLSGPVASNGRNAIIKGHQKKWHDYPDAWCTLPPGAIVEKTFFIERAPIAARGDGFRTPIRTALRLMPALNPDGFPPVRDVLARKFEDSLNRWREGPEFAGIHAFPGEQRPWIDLAWAGQSEAYAYPFLRLGAIFAVPDVSGHVQRGLDFISTAPFGPRGFAIRYNISEGRWMDRTNPLSQGQAMENMLQTVRLARGQPGLDTSRWEAFLRRACEFHATRILAADWRPKSTSEAFLVAPLIHGSILFEAQRLLEAAEKAAQHYAGRHLTMDEPYWGGTLDARCEDKEGAWAAMQAFLAMHEVTGDSRYLDWAGHAADVVLSYLYIWDVPLPPGRLADHAFKTRGWTSVSAQNMHLDVYGVLCAPAFWRLGELTGRDDLKKVARLMYVSCGQLLDAKGSQGEQIHQTNYAQHYDYTALDGVRGDYIENWNVYWISAHFLVAGAQFDEMGVDVLAW